MGSSDNNTRIMSEMETCSGTSFGISPPEQSSLMSVSPMSIQINDSLVTRLETAHSEPEISLEDDEGYITRSSPMSITPESHSPSAVKRREDVKINEFPSLLSSPVHTNLEETTTRRVPQQQQPSTSNYGDSFYKPSSNTLKLPPFAQFISNRTA